MGITVQERGKQDIREGPAHKEEGMNLGNIQEIVHPIVLSQ